MQSYWRDILWLQDHFWPAPDECLKSPQLTATRQSVFALIERRQQHTLYIHTHTHNTAHFIQTHTHGTLYTHTAHFISTHIHTTRAEQMKSLGVMESSSAPHSSALSAIFILTVVGICLPASLPACEGASLQQGEELAAIITAGGGACSHHHSRGSSTQGRDRALFKLWYLFCLPFIFLLL